METDLSLIEISGEDDSLLSLQQQHSPLISNNNSPYFSCSPLLQIPRSTASSLNPTPRSPFSTGIIKDEKDTCKPTSSLCEGIKDHNVYKENVYANKSEVPKLRVEPQQMKKKKGGGYNLRKSLAWDRAFFTEEGVLDPVELSMLSGNALSVIHEGRESLSSELDGPSASPGARALKHNSFMELPSSARKEASKVAGKMSPKLMYSAKAKMHPASPQNMKGMKLSMITEPCPQAKRKVLSAHDINRSSSKRSGCPRSLVSSSLNRTSNAIVAAKEPRVSKQLDTKNEPLVVSKTSRSSVTGASHTKSNLASQPATGKKSIGIKGISSSAKSCQNDAKTGSRGKLIRKSTAQPARSMLKLAAEQEMHSSTGLQPPKVSLENNSSEGLPDAIVPAAADPLNGHDSTSRKHASSLLQTTCYYGENKQHPQTQIAKPSGLRMPSPSLGFFGQSKSSNSHGELQKDLPSCNFPKDCIPTVSKASVLNSIQKPPRPSRKIPTCSGSVRSFTSTMNGASCGVLKSESELSDIQTVPLLLQVNSEISDTVNSEQQLADVDLKSSDDGDPCEKVEKLSCIENIGLQINDIKLPPQSACEQLEKHDGKSIVDVCPRSRDSTGARLDLPHSVSHIPLFVEVEGAFETNNSFVKQHVEVRKCKQSMSVSPESHTASMNNDPDHISSEVHGEQLTGLDEFELSPQQAELKKPGTCRIDPISEMLSQRLNETLTEDCRSSVKGVKDSISNAEDNGLEIQDCGSVSYYPTHSTEAERTKNETNGTDCLNAGLHEGEAKMLSVESTLLVSSCMSSTYASAADLNWMILSSPSAESAKQTKVLNSFSVTEQVSWKNCEPPSKGCLQYGKGSEASTSETNDTLGKQVEERKCKSSIKSYSVSPQSHTESTKNGSEVDGEQLNGLDEFELSPQQAEPKKPVTCRIGSISDMQSQRLSGTLMRDCTSPEKGNRTEISNAVDYILEVQDRSAVSYCPTHSTEVEPTKDEISEADWLNGGLHVEEVQMLPVEAPLSVVCCKSSTNSVADSNLIICDSPSARSAEQTEVLNSCFVTEQTSQNNCETPSRGCLQFGKCSEEYQQKNILQSVNNAESRASGIFCSLTFVNQDCNFVASGKMECRHVENACTAAPLVGNVRHNVEFCGEANALELDTIYKCDIIGGTEVAGTDNTAKETLIEDALRQLIDEKSLADSNKCNIDSSTETKRSLLVVNFKSRQDPELQNRDLVIEQVPLENAGLCLDDNLLLINTSIQDAVKNVPSESESFVVDVNAHGEVEYQSTRPSSDDIERYKDLDDRNDHELDNQYCPFNLGSSSNSDSYQISSVANYESKSGSLNEITNGTSSGSIHPNVHEPKLKLETIHKSDIIGETITNNVVAEKYCLNSGGEIGSKHENSDFISKISCRRVDVASGMNNPSEENFFSELQLEASYSPEKEVIVLHGDFSTDMHGTREQDEEQAQLISSCSNEVEQVNQDCELHDDTLGDENGLPQDASCIDGCGFQISHIPRKMDEVGDNTEKELLNDDTSVQFIYESSLADNNTCNVDNSMKNKRSFLVVDKSRQDPELVIEQVPLENAGLCSDDNLLLINTSIESKGEDTVQDAPSDSEVEYQSTRPSADNIECYKDSDDINYHELDRQSCPFNLGSSSNSDSYQISSVANYGSRCGSLNEEINGTSSGSSHQNVHEPYGTILPSEDEVNINESNDSFDSEMIDRLCSDVATLSLNKTVEEKKQDTPVIKPPSNAVPFSDEWLAALEAAGEEILARKGGAVQNSPTDKSSPPPNPWSPVKRKNNQGLGPFDCTKFINPTDPSSTSH